MSDIDTSAAIADLSAEEKMHRATAAILSIGAKGTKTLTAEACKTVLEQFMKLKSQNEAQAAEIERLREELGQHDGDIDQRMAALGMIPMSQLLSEAPTLFCIYSGMDSIEFFAEWVARKHAEYLKMRMRYETGKRPKDDDLFEWVLAHCGAFGNVHDQLRAALKGGAE